MGLVLIQQRVILKNFRGWMVCVSIRWVTIKDGDVIIRAKRSLLKNNKRNDLIGRCPVHVGDDDVTKRIVIIGGGPSSLVCAETLRHNGFNGRVIILSRDIHPPYDRAIFSKDLLVEAEDVYLRTRDYYVTINVELFNEAEVVGVDVIKKRVRLSNRIAGIDHVVYDKLVIATGGVPRTLEPTLGWRLGNVYVLRTPGDAGRIVDACRGKRVVVVGSSFIGMEVTSYLTSHKITSSVAVVCGRRSEFPFEKTLGRKVGAALMGLHEREGLVRFYKGVGVDRLMGGQDGTVKFVRMSDGRVTDADVVVLGIGVKPATQFLRDSEIRLTQRGFIQVDGNMATKVPNVYAIGDVTMFPLAIRGGEMVNIQHWQMAQAHGRIAALDIIRSLSHKVGGSHVRTPPPVASIPFFWTVQYGRSLRFAGCASGHDDVIIRGDLDDLKFAAYYVKNDVIVGMATMSMDPLVAEFANKLSKGDVVLKQDIQH
ncbi:apoptosis-inducing factor 3-like isoform X1 [Ciona intestinalis]